MINLNKMFDEFNSTYRIKHAGDTAKLINDELKEMLAEIPTYPEHAKECADVIYIACQQLRAKGIDLDFFVKHYYDHRRDEATISTLESAIMYDMKGVNPKSPAISGAFVVNAIHYAESLGYNWQEILKEVHRSNMSKTIPRDQAEHELIIARGRYPSAYIVEGQQDCILKCGETNKVIKPTCYSPAVIKVEWL